MAAALGFTGNSLAGGKVATWSSKGAKGPTFGGVERIGFRPSAKRERKKGVVVCCEAPSIPTSRVSSAAVLEQLKTSADRYTRERSSLAVIGLNIHTAPVEMREKLSIPEAQWPRAVQELCDLNHIEEAAVLSTCNRMEIYVVALSWHRGIKEVKEWLAKVSGVALPELRHHLFLLRDGDATRHLFEVSAGLDSLVVGEAQILSQVKQVVRVAQGNGGLGKSIDRLFKDAISAGKRVRSETKISSGAVSVSSAAVELALTKLPASRSSSSSSSARMLVIGAGKMGKLIIKHLAAKGFRKISVVNRSSERVDSIREELGADVEIVYRPFAEMLPCAAEADVIFTSTASETPLLLREHVEALPPPRSVAGPRLFVDISVPRNVSPHVGELECAEVFDVDDLKQVVEANREDRMREATEAQAIIDRESRRFEAWRDSLETVPTIKSLRSYADRIKTLELQKCLHKIGDDAMSKKIRKAVDELSSSIVNKLLHGPLQHLRCDGSDDRSLDETLENMHALNRMFGLETERRIVEQKIKAKVERVQK